MSVVATLICHIYLSPYFLCPLLVHCWQIAEEQLVVLLVCFWAVFHPVAGGKGGINPNHVFAHYVKSSVREVIHPKRWFPRFQESADNFEFSAERLSENAKSIKITLFPELLTAISPIYVQSLLNLSIKTLKHTICSTKMPHWHQILVIFMIYAIMSRNFAVRMYALFPQISLDRKTEFRRRYPFLDVCVGGR